MESGPIIDGLPWFTELKNGWIFPWQTVSHNQMVAINWRIQLLLSKLRDATKSWGRSDKLATVHIRSYCLRIRSFTWPSCKLTWVDVDTYGYGPIPIDTIFSGMNIHKSQLFWCELQGYKVLTHCHMLFLEACLLDTSANPCNPSNPAPGFHELVDSERATFDQIFTY